MATTTLPVPAAPTRLRLPESAAYVLTGFPIAVAAFVVLVPGLALGLGTLPIVLGVAVLALTLLAARGFAAVERTRLDLLLHTRVARPAYRPTGGGPVRAVLASGADPRRWLDLLHGIVGFPVAVATFCLSIGWFAAAAGGLSYVLWEWSLPRDDPDTESLAELIGLGDGRLADVLLTTALGAVFAVTLPYVVRGCAAVQSALARALVTTGD
jgi:hypothetical protein